MHPTRDAEAVIGRDLVGGIGRALDGLSLLVLRASTSLKVLSPSESARLDYELLINNRRNSAMRVSGAP